MNNTICGTESDRLEVEEVTVSILILNWNKSELTLKCLKALREHIHCSHEIILVDNGSSAREVETLNSELDPSVRLIPLTVNVFFGEGNNIASEAARGRFLLLLNNDVEVVSDIASELIETFNRCGAPGAIGPRFLCSSGEIQEVGGFLLPNGHSLRTGRLGIGADLYFRNGVKIVDYCSAACLLIERATFLRVGGFDPLFDPAYYEDADLCLRLRTLGLNVYVNSDVRVVHNENTTSSELWGMDLVRKIVEENRQRFLRRWGEYLEERIARQREPIDPRRLMQDVTNSKNCLLDQPRVLVIFDRPLDCSEYVQKLLKFVLTIQSACHPTLGLPEVCSSLRLKWLALHFGLPLADLDFIRSVDVDRQKFHEVIDCTALARGNVPIEQGFSSITRLFEMSAGG